MSTLGIIGSGNIGSAIARLAVASNMHVVIANSRGADSLDDLIAELGPLASAGTIEQAAVAGDTVVLSIPLSAVKGLAEGLLNGKVVIDTSNYYPSRDGRIADLDSNATTASALVASLLDGARYVKAFNNILAHHIPLLARTTEADDRSALPIASDDESATSQAAAVIEQLGFDTFDAGTIAQSWRFEPDSAGYTRIYLADQSTPDGELLASTPTATSVDRVSAALDSATRVNVANRAF